MKGRLFVLAAILLFGMPVWAQITTVTGTAIKDANGNPYSSGTVSAFINLNTGQPLPAGAKLSSGPFSLDGTGSFSFTLFSPATYQFTVCGTPVNLGPRGNPIPNSLCFTSGPILISGGTQDITSSLSPALLGPQLNASGSTPPGGSPTQTQVNNNGIFGGAGCETFSNKDTGPVNVNCDWHSKGPNPYVDATQFGVRAVLPGIAPGSTANCTSGSPNVPISAPSTFQNGDGVALYGCGAGTIGVPAAPTVTPSLLAAQTGLLLDVNSPAGVTTYCYQIVARKLLGATNVSSEVCTNTGQSTLGLQQKTITSATLSNTTATYTTSSAHTLAVGAHVVIEGMSVPLSGGASINFADGSGSAVASTNPFNGWFTVATVPDNTHFTVNLLADSRNGATTSGTGGTVSYWNSNHIVATDTINNYQYFVYGRVSGGTKTLLGSMWPQNSTFAGDPTYQAFDDLGSPVTTPPLVPSYIPNTVPTTSTNDMLPAIIQSGAGTTSLVLDRNAGNTISGQTILFDDAITFLAAATAATNNGASTSGPLMLPWPGSNTLSYVFNSPISLGTGATIGLTVLQKGNVWVNEPITLSNVQWYGQPTSNNSIAGFAWNPGQQITFNKANPGFYATFNNTFSDLVWLLNSTNGGLMFIQDNGGIPAAGTFKNVSFQVGQGPSANFSNMGLVFRGGAGWDFQNALLASTQNAGLGFPLTATTPGIYFNNANNSNFTNINMSGIGIATRVNPAGGFMNVYKIYSQANYIPYFSFANTGSNFSLIVDNCVFDTTNQPLIANYGGEPLNGRITNCPASAQNFYVTGSFPPGSFPRMTLELMNSTGTAQNTGTASRNSTGISKDGTFGTSYPSFPVDIFNKSISIGPGYSLFTTASPPAAATCPVSAGGSFALGTNFLYYAPIYQNGSEGALSLLCQATTTTGNQTITMSWTAIPGVTQYDVYQGTSQNNVNLCNSGAPVSGTSFVFNSGGSCAGFGGSTNQAVGGPAGMRAGLVWGQTLQLGISGFAALGTPPNGTFTFCPDCTIANPCAGGGTGALAKRLNGIWVCN